MVVMGYEKSYPWVADVKKGIESVLADLCTIY